MSPSASQHRFASSQLGQGVDWHAAPLRQWGHWRETGSSQRKVHQICWYPGIPIPGVSRGTVLDHLHSWVYSSKVPLPLFPGIVVLGGFLVLRGTFLVMIIQSLAGVFNLGSSSDHLPYGESIVVEDVVQIAGICI